MNLWLCLILTDGRVIKTLIGLTFDIYFWFPYIKINGHFVGFCTAWPENGDVKQEKGII